MKSKIMLKNRNLCACMPMCACVEKLTSIPSLVVYNVYCID